MNKVVYKYRLTPGVPANILAGEVVLCAAQIPEDMDPTIWVEHSGGTMHEEYAVIGTGHQIPLYWQHVGSCVCANGTLVWHVYRRRMY